MNNRRETILVTGASGQLGRRLVRKLVKIGFDVRAHYRSAEKAEKCCPDGCRAVIGDLTEPSWLPEAVDGCDIVIHGAARVTLRPVEYEPMHQVNVNGTAAVIHACRAEGVGRLIHISTVAAVGASKNGKILDESAVYNQHEFNLPYFITKRKAEEIALMANGKGMEVIVLNPSIMISLPENGVSAEELRKIPKRLPAYFDFGLNLVHTDDVVEGIIASIKKGRGGERYILAGENIGPDEIFRLSKKFFGLKKPLIKIPNLVLYTVGVIAELLGYIGLPVAPRINGWRLNRNFSRLARAKYYYSSAKATRELGYRFRSIENILIEITSNKSE